MIRFVLRAASTLEHTDGEQRALRKFSRESVDLSFIEKKSFAPSHLADAVEPIPAAYNQLYYALLDVKLRQVASCELQCSTLGGRSRLVHTSDGIGSGVGIGSARSVTIQCKSKIGIGDGVGSSTESESEGSEVFLFLPIPLPLPSLPIQ